MAEYQSVRIGDEKNGAPRWVLRSVEGVDRRDGLGNPLVFASKYAARRFARLRDIPLVAE